MIGKLEELTLLACIRAGNKAVPSAIYERILLGHGSIAFGAAYTTLGRLAKKGLLEETTIVDDADRQRRAFSITGAGRRALNEALNATAAIGGFAVGGADVVVA